MSVLKNHLPLLVVIFIGFCCGSSADGDEEDPRIVAANNRAVCGANCIHAVLQMRGFSSELDDIKSRLKKGGVGSSLLELKEVADELGANARIIKKSTFEYTDEELPAVVFGWAGATVRAGEEQDRIGHFVVLLELDRENRLVTFMDGTSCLVEREIPEKWFNKKMNIGFGVKLEKPSTFAYEPILATIVLGVFGVGLMLKGK